MISLVKPERFCIHHIRRNWLEHCCCCCLEYESSLLQRIFPQATAETRNSTCTSGASIHGQRRRHNKASKKHLRDQLNDATFELPMSSSLRLTFLVICLVTIATSFDLSPPTYERPLPSKDLDLRLPSLSLSGGPHSPEQVHLALAGPGSVAVSWVTHPQV